MEIVKLNSDETQDEALQTIVHILEEGGLVCLPCNGSYRIFADLKNRDAVMRLFQSKRRVHKAPSLVFVDSISRLHEITDEVDPVASALMKAIWPGPLTIHFSASKSLPRKVTKELTKANGKLGVRIPESPLAHRVVEMFGGPVLVSSANRGRRSGESSPAQVRQNFLGRVDYFLDAGDLKDAPSSTVVAVENSEVTIVRQGAVSEEKINEIAASVVN